MATNKIYSHTSTKNNFKRNFAENNRVINAKQQIILIPTAV